MRRSRRRSAAPDTVASFAINQIGLGHTSRLLAIHDELQRAETLESAFFVEHEKQLIEDYGFTQTVVPRFVGVYRDQDDVSSRPRDLAGLIVEFTLDGRRPMVLHDVFVHRALYDAAVAGGWPQALVYRDRKDVENPAAWLSRVAPAVSSVFWAGRPGEGYTQDGVAVHGVEDIVRRPIGQKPFWDDRSAELRVLITAGGGGRPDAEPFLNAAIAGVDALARRSTRSVEARVVTGPFYRSDVEVPASSPVKVTVTRYVPPTDSMYWGSSVVVAQSGYNTFHELGLSAIPHVLVPGGAFGVDDQKRRAETRTDDDVRVVDCDPVAIAKGIEDAMAAPPRQDWPSGDGTRGAAQIAARLTSL